MRDDERKHFNADKTHGLGDIKSHVVQDFVDNKSYFEKLFSDKGAKFPGFMSSRLPGDGRFQKEIVRAVVAKMKVPHFGWDVEFAPNGKMGHVNQNNWEGVGGVASTVEWAKQMNAQSIILLHDSHWKPDLQDSLTRLVEKLMKLATLEPLPSAIPKSANETFKKNVVPVD